MSQSSHKERDAFPGERLSSNLLLQDLEQVSGELREQPNGNRGSKVEQRRLYTLSSVSTSPVRFDRGECITDQVVNPGAVMLQVREGKSCFQADGEHRHPDAAKNLVAEPGISHSPLAEKPSTVLLTIVRESWAPRPFARNRTGPSTVRVTKPRWSRDRPRSPSHLPAASRLVQPGMKLGRMQGIRPLSRVW